MYRRYLFILIILFFTKSLYSQQGNCVYTYTGGIFVPNAFTPNGDGVNDILYVINQSNCCTLKVLKIFDRWGEKVFETTDENIGWDGTYKGKLVNVGVFVYYLQTDCDDEVKMGSITVLL